jgi:pheromone a factor receptor
MKSLVEYIIQGHRFNIFEQIGCYPALYNALPMYFLNNMWPVVLGLLSAIYGGEDHYYFIENSA